MFSEQGGGWAPIKSKEFQKKKKISTGLGDSSKYDEEERTHKKGIGGGELEMIS